MKKLAIIFQKITFSDKTMIQLLMSHQETNFKELVIRFGVICTTLYRVFDHNQKMGSERPKIEARTGGKPFVYISSY